MISRTSMSTVPPGRLQVRALEPPTAPRTVSLHAQAGLD